MRGVLARLLVGATAGVATGLAFPPYGAWWLLPFSVAALSLAIRSGHGFRIGLAYGLAFMVVLLPWLTVIGPDAWLGLSFLESLFYGLLGWGLHRVSRLPGWPVWQACLWVAVEWLQGPDPLGGFNWGRLAFATIDAPVAPAVTLVAMAGVTFLVALSGGLLAWAAQTARAGGRVWSLVAAAGALALVCLPLVFPAWQPPEQTDPVRIAVVQGNVPGEGMDAFAERRAVLNNHVDATRDFAAAGRQRARNRAPGHRHLAGELHRHRPLPRPDRATRDHLRRGRRDRSPRPGRRDGRRPGPQRRPEQGHRLASRQTGPTEAYAKTHPVPFGEYIPMRKFLAQLHHTGSTRSRATWSPGRRTACSSSGTPGSATSSASRSSTTT